jgi:hypothetical protein
MRTVKLITTFLDLPLINQTPDNSGIWGDIYFKCFQFLLFHFFLRNYISLISLILDFLKMDLLY